MKISYTGNIPDVRAVEDCIRATRKYTEGVLSKQHPQQIQGEDFPSRTLHKHYEFYPDVTEISWNMPVNTALDWLFSDTPCIVILFRYDYRNNQAIVTFSNQEEVDKTCKAISGLRALVQIIGKNVVVNTTAKTMQRVVDA